MSEAIPNEFFEISLLVIVAQLASATFITFAVPLPEVTKEPA